MCGTHILALSIRNRSKRDLVLQLLNLKSGPFPTGKNLDQEVASNK